MKLVVNKSQRYAKMRSHTWVHLLYWALEKVLNRDDIKQAGSYVDEDYGRLDFNADKPLSLKQLQEIEDLVNKWIYEAIPVEILETSLDEAVKQWAKAFFDEKYWEKVRIIKIPWADIQLCGGTHSPNTNFVWAFKIISQEAVASWIKRIVIVTWPKVTKFAQEKENYIYQIAEKLESAPAQILQKVEKLGKELEKSKQEIENFRTSVISSKLKSLEKQNWDFDYIIKLEDFEWIDFKTLVSKVRENLNWKILVYSQAWNFAIVSDGGFSAKEFAKNNWLKWGWNDIIVQWRDEKILTLI